MELCFYSYNPVANVHLVRVFESESKLIDPLRVFKKAREEFKLEFSEVDIKDTEAISRAMVPGVEFVLMLEDGERVFGLTTGWTKELMKRIENAQVPVKIRRTFVKSPTIKEPKE